VDSGKELTAELAAICGPDHVLTHPDALATYRSDGLAHYRQTPLAAVLPGNGDEVRRVVRACFEEGVPWVARGSGTGLSGGALPISDGVLIVLARLRRILSVELEDARVVVEPGVTNLAVSRVVAPTHFYPPDPSSQIVCSIGGNIAENSGGAHCFKYGFTTNYVTGLEVVLSDATVVELDRDEPGYDLLGAFVGSEGTLGVATRITLRVTPTPEHVRTLLAFFDDTGLAGEVVTAIVSAGIVPGAIEMMDRLSIRAAEEATGAGYRLDVGAALIVELDGPEDECTARFEQVKELCSRAGALEVRVAESAGQRELIWKARKAAFAAMGRISPAYFVQDGVIPRTRLSEVLRRIDALSAEYGLRVANVFHAGDGNLHPLVCYDAARDGEPERAEKLAGEIVRVCVEEGGSITGEHGVGVDKKAHMPAMFSEPDLEAFQRLRCAFDPHGLANPGKVMPTPRLCGEVPGPYREHPLERAGVATRL
jgi:glycolate dehydrogenase FAD-linked subunit